MPPRVVDKMKNKLESCQEVPAEDEAFVTKEYLEKRLAKFEEHIKRQPLHPVAAGESFAAMREMVNDLRNPDGTFGNENVEKYH